MSINFLKKGSHLVSYLVETLSPCHGGEKDDDIPGKELFVRFAVAAVYQEDPFCRVGNFQKIQDIPGLHPGVPVQVEFGFSTPGKAGQGGKKFYGDRISQCQALQVFPGKECRRWTSP